MNTRPRLLPKRPFALLSAALPALALTLALTGCAAPARTDQMQVGSWQTVAANSPLKEAVAIKAVTGGHATGMVSKVSNADFSRALEASLKSAGLFSGDSQGSRYMLAAQLKKLEQPGLGLNYTVTATVQYTLVERQTGKPVFTRTVAEPFTATLSDSMDAPTRLQLANEGAVRVNIKRLIDALLAAKL